jgi:outer membrane protein OmpA-like peptidoglycan-associated protein
MGVRPQKWIVPGILGAGLPFLGAWWFGAPGLDQRLEEAARASLAAVGAGWAEVAVDGRDAVVSGEGPTDAALAAAREALATTYGIRRVDATGLSLAPPLAPPAIASLVTADPAAPITGTWPEAAGAGLSVTLGAQTFVLGTDPGLTSDGRGNWSLVPPEGLPDGAMDVSAEVVDRFKRVARADWPGQYVLDRAPPATPTIDSFVGQRPPGALAGTWAEGDATSLKVTFGGRTYVLGADPELATKDRKWSLALPADLPDGQYPAKVETADAAGNAATAENAAAILVDGVSPAPPGVVEMVATAPVARLAGTWDEAGASRLTVTVDGHSYERGTFMGLRSAGKGKWVLDLPQPLGEGSHAVVVANADAAGNVAMARFARAIIVDSKPSATPTVDQVMAAAPVTVLTGTWDDADATSLKVTAGGSTYQKGVYNGLTVSPGGKWRLALAAPLGEGRHTVAIETADAAGNISSSINPGAITVDLTPPAAPTVSPVLSAAPVARLAGTFDRKDSATLEISVAGRTYVSGTFLGLRTGNETWTLDLPEPLDEGRHDVVLTAADAAGNTVTTTAAAAVTVDRTPPAPPAVDALSTDAPLREITGTWDSTDARSLRVTVAGSTYEHRVYMGLTTAGNAWALALPAPLGTGTYDVSVETADATGNVSRSERSNAIVVAITSAVPTVTALVTANPAPEIGGTIDRKAQSFAVSVAGKVYASGKDAALTRDADGNWKLVPPEPLPDGTHDVVVVATDVMGERSSDRTLNELVIDTKAPAPPTVDRLAGNNPQPRLGGTLAADAATLAVALNGKFYVLGKDPGLERLGETLWTLTPESPLPEGVFDVVVVTADSLGNRSSDETVGELTIDLTGPAAPAVNAQAGNNPAPVITGTVPPDIGSFAVAIGGKVYTLGTDAALAVDGTGNWSLKLPEALKDGIYDVVAVASDTYGNRSSDTTVGEVTIDTVPPDPPTVDRIAGNDPQLAINGTWAKDARRLTIAVAGKVYVLGTDAGVTASPEGVWSLKPEVPLPEGVHDVVVVTEDAYGNRASDATVGEITIDLTGPAPPTIAALSGDDPQPVLAGTMDPESRTFAVAVAGKVYTLGRDAALLVDARGNWSLKLPEALKPGRYDVIAVATDANGNRSSDDTRDELEILEKKSEAAPAPGIVAQPPTIQVTAATVPRPELAGTWSEMPGSSLAVTLAGETYRLGEATGLVSDGQGNWRLPVPVPLRDGTYDVEVVSTGADGAVLRDATAGELTVDAMGPASPTVGLFSGEKSPERITGTWAEGDAQTLSVTVAGSTHTLGTAPSLTTDGKGNWALVLDAPLPPGSYDVVAVNADARGRTAADQTRFEILVKELVMAQPVPAPMPGRDCNAELAQLLILRPITFETARARIRPEAAPAIAGIAQLMKDCPHLKFTVSGHTDSRASTPYNQALSERRAVAVRKALIAAGVEPARLQAVGLGERQPLASNGTAEGRALNRRIEITAIN